MTHGRADGGKPKQERQVAASHIMEECLTTDNMAGVDDFGVGSLELHFWVTVNWGQFPFEQAHNG